MFKIKFNISWTYLIFKTRILLAVIFLQILFNVASCQHLQAASSSPALLAFTSPNLAYSGVYNKNRSQNPNVNLQPRNVETHPHQAARLKTEAIVHPGNVPTNNGNQRRDSVSTVVSRPEISKLNDNSNDQDVRIVSSIELKAESSVFPTVGVIGFKYPESDVNWRPEKSLLDMTEALIKDDVQEYLYRKHKEKEDSEVVTIEKSKEIIPGEDLSNYIPQSTREPDYDGGSGQISYGNIWGTTEGNYAQFVTVSPPQSTSSRPIDPRYVGIWETTTSTKKPIDPQFAGIWETTTSTRTPIDPQYAGLWETTTPAKPTVDPRYSGLWETKDVSKPNLDQYNENSKQKITYDSYEHRASSDELADDSSQPNVKYTKHGFPNGKSKKHHHVEKYGHTHTEPYTINSGEASQINQESPKNKNEEPYYKSPKGYSDADYKDEESGADLYRDPHISIRDTPQQNRGSYQGHREHVPTTYHPPIDSNNRDQSYTEHKQPYHPPKEYHNKPDDYREHVSSYYIPTDDYSQHEATYRPPNENHNKPDDYPQHEPTYHPPRENHNKYHDYTENDSSNQAPSEYRNKHHEYHGHAPTHQPTIENHNQHSDYAEQGSTYETPTANYKEEFDNGGKAVKDSGSLGVKQHEDNPHAGNSEGSWEVSTPEKIQNEFLQQVQSIREGNGNTWQASGPGAAFHSFQNPFASNEQGFANSPIPVIPVSPIAHGVGQNVYYWPPPSQVKFFGHKDPGVQYHWQPIHHVPTESYGGYEHNEEESTPPLHETNTNYDEGHNRSSANSERHNEGNFDTRSNDDKEINTAVKSEASSDARYEEPQEGDVESREQNGNYENQEAEGEGETQEGSNEQHDEEYEKQKEESSGNSDNKDPYYDEKFGTDAAFKRPPPDYDEERVKGFVSDHEFPRKVPTRLAYQGGGLWAKPHPDSGIQLGFVPTQVYTQVRRHSTVKHLPREEAYAAASTPEEIINAPRLREVVSHKKTQEVS